MRLVNNSRNARKKGSKNVKREFLTISETSPFVPFVYKEAYKSLRTNLNFISVNNEYKKIIVTSSIPAEGKSNVAINLSISLAQNGSKVLLIDCDLRSPMIYNYLKINKRAKGLTSLLSGEATMQECISQMSDNNVSVICAGVIPPNPAEMLGSAKMGTLIESLEKEYEYIIFDTPPVSVVTDAAVLSKYADGVLLVVRQKFCPIESAKQALSNLTKVNANIIGSILNNYDAKTSGKEYSHYNTDGYSYPNRG